MGFLWSFFKKSWFVVGDDVIAAIKGFFSSGRLLKSTNATIYHFGAKEG